MRILFTTLVLLFGFKLYSQDSIVVMQYNLLNYGNYTGFCNASNNSHVTKDGYLRTIINYAKPDVFTVNELSSVAYYHDRILTEVMNSDGRKYYKRSPATNLAGSSIINMLFYDSTKLTLHSSAVLQINVRDINLYKLYFNTQNLQYGDTIFLNCIVAHLKAGNTSSDQTSRGVMATNAINWLNSNAAPGNYLFMGDFNLYTHLEPAYQTFTGPAAGSFQFFDPVNAPGVWSNNIQYAQYHTQSVVTSGSGCQSTGGMDDRFDFILATDDIIEGAKGVKYKSGSYRALGQDGNHFNQSITNLPNNSVPYDVLTALGNMSDHLPVRMVLNVSAELPGSLHEIKTITDISVTITSGTNAELRFISKNKASLDITIYNSLGQRILSKNETANYGMNSYTLNLGRNSGFFVISIQDTDNNRVYTIKTIK